MWKEIFGFEGEYFVSDSGLVKNKKGHIFHPPISHAGYHIICLRTKGCIIGGSVHRLVAKAFIPNPENKATVNHKNGIKTDNRVENLEWNTQKENKIHASSIGLVGSCETHGMAKFKNRDIPIIRQRLVQGESCANIASDYKVHRSTIHRINKNQMWSKIQNQLKN